MASRWLGMEVSIADVPTPLVRYTTDTWLAYGSRAVEAPMRRSLAHALSKAVPGSGVQQHDLRRLMAAEVLRAWHSDINLHGP